MTVLRDLSLVWSLIHILVLFVFLYESRYNRKTTLILTCIFMIPLGALNIAGVVLYGPELMGQILAFTCTLPSALFFFLIAKNRNWKFWFTFCVVDTLSYSIVIISRLIDYYIFGDKYIAMLIIRLVAFPLMEWLAYRYVRKPLAELKIALKSGWAAFTVVTMIYYALLLIMFSYPTMIIYRTEYVPALLLVLILMPITYLGFFRALRNQMKAQNNEARYQILELQSQALDQRIEEIGVLEDKLRIQRHDMRHQYSVLAHMLKDGRTEDALQYVNATEILLESTKEKNYCTNPAINAVFHYYMSKAEQNGIKTEVQIAFPDQIELNVTELSVVIANALENAVNACLKLPVEERIIKCKSVNEPQFMLRISNSFDGNITFGQDGLPKNEQEGHGIGVHSISAFCEKYDVYYEFKVEGEMLVFSMLK